MERIQKCPRFSTICSAVDGDEIAMEKILNHYNAYISKVRTTIMKAILNFELEIK